MSSTPNQRCERSSSGCLPWVMVGNLFLVTLYPPEPSPACTVKLAAQNVWMPRCSIVLCGTITATRALLSRCERPLPSGGHHGSSVSYPVPCCAVRSSPLALSVLRSRRRGVCGRVRQHRKRTNDRCGEVLCRHRQGASACSA